MKQLSVIALMLCSWALNAQETEVVNIENQAVRSYLADETYYYDNDYNTSVIQSYNTLTYGDRPQGKTVSWVPTVEPEDIADIIITLSNNPDYSDAITRHAKRSDATSSFLCNMIPGLTYYYKVDEVQTTGTVTEVASGSFVTEGQVRMVYADGVRNMRDMGGWPTVFGVPIMYGKLYRSAKLDDVSENGKIELVDNVGIMAEVDLRANSPNSSSPLGSNVNFAVIAGGQYMYGLETRPERQVNSLRWIIARLREGKSVNFHCEQGCDRAGTLAFLIEGLLGVTEVDLCRDYELSTLSGNKRVRSYSTSTSGFADMLPDILSYGNDVDLAQCFYNYWIAKGMTPGELDEFRYLMLGMWIEPTAVEVVEVKKTQAAIYDIMGNKLSRHSQGLNIIVNSDGTVTKRMGR